MWRDDDEEEMMMMIMMIIIMKTINETYNNFTNISASNWHGPDDPAQVFVNPKPNNTYICKIIHRAALFRTRHIDHRQRSIW
jgi:hypothetical protein